MPEIVDEAMMALLAEEEERQAQIDALHTAVNGDQDTRTSPPAALSPSNSGSSSTSKPDTTSPPSGSSPPRKSRSSSTPEAVKSGAATPQT
jgi:hypothetical protein